MRGLLYHHIDNLVIIEDRDVWLVVIHNVEIHLTQVFLRVLPEFFHGIRVYALECPQILHQCVSLLGEYLRKVGKNRLSVPAHLGRDSVHIFVREELRLIFFHDETL